MTESPFMVSSLEALPWPDTVLFRHLQSQHLNIKMHKTITSHVVFYKRLHVKSHSKKIWGFFISLPLPYSLSVWRNISVTLSFLGRLVFEISNLTLFKFDPIRHERTQYTRNVGCRQLILKLILRVLQQRAMYFDSYKVETFTIKYFY